MVEGNNNLRVSFEGSAAEALHNLVKTTTAQDTGEVMQNALAFYAFVAREIMHSANPWRTQDIALTHRNSDGTYEINKIIAVPGLQFLIHEPKS